MLHVVLQKKIERLVEHSKEAVQKALNKGWTQFVDRSVIRVASGYPAKILYDVKATIANMLFELVKALRKHQFDHQCTTKAADAYFRLQLQKETGHTDNLGRFFQKPRCEQLLSIREPCDSDYVKKCTSVVKPGLDAKSKPKCVKRLKGNVVDLQKIVFCPRIINGDQNTVCQVRRTCRSEKGQHVSPLPDCYLF